MAKPNVSDVIVQTLATAGVDAIYGVVGDSLNGITDSLLKHKSIRWVHVRHEEVAAFAAAGAAHVTGRLAVCAGSCGPGNLHLINGLYDAHRSRVPVLAIAAQIPSAELGSGYFQETRPEALFRECSHYCETISSPEQAPRLVELAIRAAVGQRGVAVLVIPGDVALKAAVTTAISEQAALLPKAPRILPSEEELDALASLLNSGKKITLLAGRGCAGAHTQLLQLAETLKAPIVHALGGKEHVAYDNPYDVGMTGLIGFSSGYHTLMAADVVLMLGTDFPYRQFYPENAKIAQIDLRPEQLGRRCTLAQGLVGDVADTLDALLPRLPVRSDSSHLDHSLHLYAKARHGLDDLATAGNGKAPIHPQYLTRLVDQAAADDAIFTADVGTPTVWAARYLTMNGRRQLIGSFVHGSMANALPQAIGAQVAQPKRQVISISGDGGFTMLMGDLITLTQEKLPVKLVIVNNGSLGFVAMEMKAAGYLETGVNLQNPDFAAMARAMGLHAVRVENPADLPAAVDDILNHPGPAVLDAVTNTQELALPPKIEKAQITGFSLYALKAVMNGRGDEILDVARTNIPFLR
ncbi:ubiquinone-dependent pyruvate dehydrogenase [Acetobacter persici]|uniref:Pyruvate dehydrogenase [ubiquinone] n=1 Tax=Acetobacter persici TaxID=1076596 RepID=A0A6V8I3D9_9PROT|nr:ubiquinone-dependent pyruvate dehydrogenase [Acetobacter persici]OUI92099.1 pyruvate dehydrogenase [Acetobacter persici]GFE92034.1 pyruvate dehydrogenase [Acetobacter persici]